MYDTQGNYLIPAKQLKRISNLYAQIRALTYPGRVALAILAHHAAGGSKLVPAIGKSQMEFSQLVRCLREAGHLNDEAAFRLRECARFGVRPPVYSRGVLVSED